MRTITLSAPGKNALSRELMAWIVVELGKAGGVPLFITGEGDAFCAGLNLKELTTLSPAGMQGFLGTLEMMVEALYTYPGPTVAYVNGHAIAGGCIVALACDMRIGLASDTARIGLNEVPLGLRFPPKTWRMVKHRLSPPALERVVLEGGLYPPAQALRLGLLDELVASEGEARVIAERLASSPFDAYVAAKRALRSGALDVTEDELRQYLHEVLPTWTSGELKARIEARLRKA
jgi:enoyl-CoA hydratase/carnithine racemase